MPPSLIAAAATKPLLAASITGLQVAGTLGSYGSQLKQATPYGKFARGAQLNVPVPSRIGMLIIYTPAFLWLGTQLKSCPAMDMTLSALAAPESRLTVLTAMLLGHFGKRVAETLFVHRFSGQADGAVNAFIGAYYTGCAWIFLHFFRANVTASMLSPHLLAAGAACYAVGQLGNLYHHILLRRLRDQKSQSVPSDASSSSGSSGSSSGGSSSSSSGSAKKYFAPTGGLFGLVATPHYLFELLSWLGMAMVAQHGNAFLVFTSMSSYLAGRSKVTNEWNAANIDGYAPKKNLIPGMF